MRTSISNLLIALKTGAAETARAYSAEIAKRPKTSEARVDHAATVAVLAGVASIQEAAIEKAEGLLAGVAYEIEIAQAGELIGLLQLDTPCPIKANTLARALRDHLAMIDIEATLYSVEINKSRVLAVAQYPR